MGMMARREAQRIVEAIRKPSNAASVAFRRNPKGRGFPCTKLCRSSLVCNPAHVVPRFASGARKAIRRVYARLKSEVPQFYNKEIAAV